MYDLPQTVQEVAAVIGRERTLYLIGQLPQCGKRPWRVLVYVPSELPPDHQLVKILGREDAEKLSREFGGLCLQLGRCIGVVRKFRNKAIERMYREGMEAEEIAEVFQLTDRAIRNILHATTDYPRRGS
jgi:hypothetical protein